MRNSHAGMNFSSESLEQILCLEFLFLFCGNCKNGKKYFVVKYLPGQNAKFFKAVEEVVSDEKFQLEKIYHGKSLYQILGSTIPSLSRVVSSRQPGLLLNQNLGQ